MEVLAFSKSKSGKKSIPTYTVSTHHDFSADIAAKFAETVCTRYAEALDKATQTSYAAVYVESRK